jgi:hypothetical protein
MLSEPETDLTDALSSKSQCLQEAMGGNFKHELRNIVVHWLAPLPRTSDVPSSNPGQETGYYDLLFRGFPQLLQKWWDISANHNTVASVHIVPNSLIIDHAITG